jgi:hypothetical protein
MFGWKSPEVTFSRLTWQPLVTSGLRASGAFERGHEYLPKSRSDFLSVDVAVSRYFRTSGFGLLNAGMNISRSDFLPVDVAASHHFGTSGLRGFCLVINPCTTLKLQMHESR